MTSLAVTLAAVIVLVALIGVARRLIEARESEPARYPFEQCRPPTDREQVLYWRLRKALPDQIVLSQVALSRLLRVERGQNYRTWLNRIDRMTVDFLVCLPDSTIVAAIELDDASHKRAGRPEADAKKTKALESAGIKLLRYSDIPSEEQIRSAFF